MSEPALTAIVYDEGSVVAELAARIAARWQAQGVVACGLVETQIPRANRRR